MRLSERKPERMSAASAALAVLLTVATIVSVTATVSVAVALAWPARALAEASAAGAPASAGNAAWEAASGINYSLYQRRVFSINASEHCERTTSVASTSDGLLWMGTYDGVYRFDGSDAQRMDFGAVHAVNCLFVDADDNLWIGTNDNGIAVARDGELLATFKQSDGLPSNTVRTLTADTDGRVYAGTSNGVVTLGLRKAAGEKGAGEKGDAAGSAAADGSAGESGAAQHVVLLGKPSVEQPTSLAAGADNLVAATDEDGFLTLIQDGEATDVEVPADSFQYTAVAFGPQGVLYAGRSDGTINLFDVSDGQLEQTGETALGRETTVNALCLVDGTLFACTEDGVAYQARGGTSPFAWLSTGSFNGAIQAMGKDFQGNLWFVSPRIGLMELYRSPAVNLFQAADLDEVVVNSITEWQGLHYFGTDHGLTCIDPAAEASVPSDLATQVGDVPVQCVLTDSQDNLWICTFGNGVLRVGTDGSQTSYTAADGLFGNKTRMAVELRDGRVAVCDNDGISIIAQDGSIQHTLVRQTGNAPVLCVMEEDDGTLLAGTDGDGISDFTDGTATKTYTTADGLPSNTVRRISQSPVTGRIYVTTNNGIAILSDQFDGSYEVEQVRSLPSVNAYNVRIRADGTLLIPSSAGLYVVKEDDLLSDKKDPDYLLLNDEWGITDALTADACNYVDARDNFYLASSEGAYLVSLKDYDKVNVSYRLAAPRVSLDEKDGVLEPGGRLELGQDVQRVAIEPELVNFNVTDPTVRYWLEGYDKKHVKVPASRLNQITYTNLPAGKYVFHLEVLDTKGEVRAKQTFQLTKPLAFYQSWWFITLAVTLGAFAASWGLAAARGRRALKRQQERHEQEMRIKEQQVKTANEGIMAIAKALDARDRYTSQHSTRVSTYSCQLGHELGLGSEECENLRKVALLHDIGKIGVPDRILNKPGRLTDEEYAAIKRHVDYGAEILSNFTSLDHVVEGALYHHERYDGHGYTHGLKGDQIPLYGRIIGVADAFDAMTSNRCYRGHLDLDEVLAELERCRGTQFDPQIADAMIRLVRDGKIDLSA